MDGWRIGRLVMLAGGLGMVVGALLAAAADDSRRDVLGRSTTGSVALSLLLLGLAAWHSRAWGLGKLAAVGLLAAGGLQFTLYDFGDGTPLWEEGFTGVELVARWVLIAAAAIVLIGVLWSFVELTRSPGRRSEDVVASVAWWRRWGVLVVGVAVALWVLGQVFAETEEAIDTADEGDAGPVEDEWSIVTHLSDDVGTYRDVHLITTLRPLGEADIESLGGRLEWPDTELELCGVEIMSVVEGAVQVGGYFPNTEECEPAMVEAFDEHGLPDTGCLYVRVDGVDDEHCAPLALDEREIEGP